MEILVTNIPPEINSDVDIPELQLFRAYVGDNNALPYFHQSLAFKQIRKGENVTLVAGTAAGKTLAVAVPLLIKLKSDRIKKVMFLYPTIALLEDQQQVIQRLQRWLAWKKKLEVFKVVCHGFRLSKILIEKLYWLLQMQAA